GGRPLAVDLRERAEELAREPRARHVHRDLAGRERDAAVPRVRVVVVRRRGLAQADVEVRGLLTLRAVERERVAVGADEVATRLPQPRVPVVRGLGREEAEAVLLLRGIRQLVRVGLELVPRRGWSVDAGLLEQIRPV